MIPHHHTNLEFSKMLRVVIKIWGSKFVGWEQGVAYKPPKPFCIASQKQDVEKIVDGKKSLFSHFKNNNKT